MCYNLRSTPTTENKKNPGKRFDEEFKREAARLASQAGRTDEQVARDLGVSAWSVSRWRKQFGMSKSGQSSALSLPRFSGSPASCVKFSGPGARGAGAGRSPLGHTSGV